MPYGRALLHLTVIQERSAQVLLRLLLRWLLLLLCLRLIEQAAGTKCRLLRILVLGLAEGSAERIGRSRGGRCLQRTEERHDGGLNARQSARRRKTMGELRIDGRTRRGPGTDEKVVGKDLSATTVMSLLFDGSLVVTWALF